MMTSKLSRFGLGLLGALALGAVALPAAPAKADSFAFSYNSGGYYPRGYYPRHYHGPHHGYRAGVVYVAPPPVYYAPPPPRVVYVNPPPVYAAPPPVVYQVPPQPLPGGPLASNQQCREYQSTAVVNGQRVPSYGTACLQPDGSWQIVR